VKLIDDDALIAALEQALAASEREKKVAVMFGDAFEDAAKGCHWMLEYERGLRHVIVANWMYASRADEAYAAGYDAAMQQVEFKDEALDGMHAQLREAEAEVALRDRMLRDIIERIALTPERWNGWTTEEVLADLRARAEKEATDAT